MTIYNFLRNNYYIFQIIYFSIYLEYIYLISLYILFKIYNLIIVIIANINAHKFILFESSNLLISKYIYLINIQYLLIP